MVLVELDGNRILVEPMKGKTSSDMVRSYNTLVNRLNSSGIEPKLHILDNACLKEFAEAIEKQGMRHQSVPPHDHCCNITEKAT